MPFIQSQIHFNEIFSFIFDKTALHIAVEKEYIEIIQILLQHTKINKMIKDNILLF